MPQLQHIMHLHTLLNNININKMLLLILKIKIIHNKIKHLVTIHHQQEQIQQQDSRDSLK